MERSEKLLRLAAKITPEDKNAISESVFQVFRQEVKRARAESLLNKYRTVEPRMIKRHA